MSVVIEFGLLGLGAGGLYVLLGLGVVLIYRGSGTINFAQGAVAMIATYVFWELNGIHWPYAAAAGVSVLLAAVIGAAIHLLIMRPLRNASLWMRIVATLAILATLEALATLIFGPNADIVPSELPTSTWRIGQIVIPWNQTIIFLIVLFLVGALWWVYRYTRFGLATAATAENRRATAALGYLPDRIATANWAIGSALGAVAGILLAPISGITVTQFTLLVIPALAAAIVGNMASFPLTLLGGLAIGVIESEMSRYLPNGGWPTTAPFIALLVLLLVRGKVIVGRSERAVRMPRVGTGRVRITTIVPCLIGGLLLIYFVSPIWDDALVLTLSTGIILLSLVVITGYTGQLSLAQLTLAGVGAMIAGQMASKLNAPFELVLLAAMVGVLPVGLIVGLIGTRVRGINLAIATLSVAYIFDYSVFNNNTLTGGFDGLPIKPPRFFGIDVDPITHSARYGMLALILFALAAFVLANLRKSQVGRRLLSVRANERAAESLGINTRQTKVYAFLVGSALAALGGTLLAFRDPVVQASNFDTLDSIHLVELAVIGGVGWLAGAVVGGTAQTGSLSAQVLDLLGQNWDIYLPVIGGVLLLAIVIYAPDGIAPFKYKVVELIDRAVIRRRGRPLVEKKKTTLSFTEEGYQHSTPVSLEVRDLTVRFGGVVALDNVSLHVSPGEVVGLMGPNGAGKTTLIDAVSGFVRASGTVLIDDNDVSTWPVRRRAIAGIGRSFQSLELFEDLTILENLKCASEAHTKPAYIRSFFHPVVPPLTAGTEACIKEFRLEDCLTSLPADLPYGQRRLVAIARTVAMEPGILLLDEPVAGLDHKEAEELGRLIRQLAKNWGLGILLIEHNVGLMLNSCDRLYVLDFGHLVAEGTPEAIRNDEGVIRAYLGETRKEEDSEKQVVSVTSNGAPGATMSGIEA